MSVDAAKIINVYKNAGLGDRTERCLADIKAFANCFDAHPDVVSTTPGRICLLGEHVDYHGGTVITLAINNRTTVLLRKRSDSIVHLRNASPSFAPIATTVEDINDVSVRGSGWQHYVLAVYYLLRQQARGGALPPKGFDLFVGGDMPVSAGLSSSAALQVGVGEAFNRLDNLGLSAIEICLLCQQAEVLCSQDSGIMDQVAVCSDVGDGEAVVIDCLLPAIVDRFAVPVDIAFATIASGVRAEKAESEYNIRVAVGLYALKKLLTHLSERGIERIQGMPEPLPFYVQKISDGESLDGILRQGCTLKTIFDRVGDLPLSILEMLDLLPQEITLGDLQHENVQVGGDFWQKPENRDRLARQPLQLRSNIRHVFSEMQRTKDFLEAFKCGDFAHAGALMYKTHESLAVDYGAGWDMGNLLVEQARTLGALGARQVGAGFGGSVVAMVHANEAQEFADRWAKQYHKESDIDATVIVVKASAGSCAFNLKGSESGSL